MQEHGPDAYKKTTISKKCKCLLSTVSSSDDYAQEVHEGLSRTPKSISSRFFYDQRGSMLFERICDLPEYYVTRSEISILEGIGPQMQDVLRQTDSVVELGSGSSTKTRLVLDLFDPAKSVRYIPIDVSHVILDVARDLCEKYGNLHVTGIVDTYESGLRHVKNMDVGKKLVIFLGSSIGNFGKEDARQFLAGVFSSMNGGDHLLIGIDLVKDRSVLERAYNDSANVTGQFNMNILRRINDELGGKFVLENFEHVAIYDEEHQRIEMYLRSLKAHKVKIEKLGMTVRFEEGETIHTEYSHKYNVPDFEAMLQDIGYGIKNVWKDENGYFALVLASKSIGN